MTIAPSTPVEDETIYILGFVPAEGCMNTDNGAKDSWGDACVAYDTDPNGQTWCGGYDDSDFNSLSMCCICGGGEQAPVEPEEPEPLEFWELDLSLCPNDDLNEAILCAHNQARARHVDTEPLELRQDLINDALAWSKKQNRENKSGHSTWGQRQAQGENLWWGYVNNDQLGNAA